MADDAPRVRLSCRDCSFEKVVGPEEDVKPADVLIEHGQRTGHELNVSRVEDGDQ
jgi:hypothetical protein